MSKFLKLVCKNKPAAAIGILIGGIGTKFLEDSNLLVNTVLTAATTALTIALWLILKKLK